MLTRFKGDFPGVTISLHVDDTHAVIERVLSREFEIGAVGAVTPRPELVAEPLARGEKIGARLRAHAPVAAVARSGEPRRRARGAALVQQQGAGVRMVVEHHLRRAGVRPERLNVVMDMGSWSRPSRRRSPVAA